MNGTIYETNDYKVKPFADKSGIYFIIIRKRNRNTVGKIPLTTKAETLRKVKNRIRELSDADRINFQRLKNTELFLKKSYDTGVKGVAFIDKLFADTPKKKKRKKSSKKNKSKKKKK